MNLMKTVTNYLNSILPKLWNLWFDNRYVISCIVKSCAWMNFVKSVISYLNSISPKSLCYPLNCKRLCLNEFNESSDQLSQQHFTNSPLMTSFFEQLRFPISVVVLWTEAPIGRDSSNAGGGNRASNRASNTGNPRYLRDFSAVDSPTANHQQSNHFKKRCYILVQLVIKMARRSF